MEIYITQARCWRSKQCLTSISLNRAPGKLSWILNTYFKNKLPSSEKKAMFEHRQCPKSPSSDCFLGKPAIHRHQTGNALGKGGGRTLATPKERAVGKAAGKHHGSHALEEPRGIPAWSCQVPVQDSCPLKHFPEGSRAEQPQEKHSCPDVA